ncbi:hypothetical protein F5Y04DRAFT_19689 [Hypomontagnella monticulosa]|nr:hypothetical protein F5Y04DRAFT_19689 [Hypomontagnella monticulosa]
MQHIIIYAHLYSIIPTQYIFAPYFASGKGAAAGIIYFFLTLDISFAFEFSIIIACCTSLGRWASLPPFLDPAALFRLLLDPCHTQPTIFVVIFISYLTSLFFPAAPFSFTFFA